MKITEKLLGYLHRVFKKDPVPFVAFQIASDGSNLNWIITDETMTLSPTGGSASALSLDLTQYTIAGLADHIGSQTGYSIIYVDASRLAGLSALALVDGSGNTNVTGGNIITGQTSLLWAWLDGPRAELKLARTQVKLLPSEMSTTTADTIWLDYIGDETYGVPRNIYTVNSVPTAELDSQYAPRIVSEIIMPRGNNIAISEAIRAVSGQPASVVDAPVFTNTGPFYDGTFNFDGSHHYSGTSATHYGLFDVTYAYDLEGSLDIGGLQALIIATVNKFRDAGTFLRSLSLQAGLLSDQVAEPADGGIALTIFSPLSYNGARKYDGTAIYSGGSSVIETV